MIDRFTQVVSTYGPKLAAEFGFSPEQNAGFWGNFARETGEFKFYQEIGSGPNTGGRGFAQWTGPRRVAFLGYCKAHKLDPKSDAASYAYLCVELHGTYKNVVAAVKRCKTVEAATQTVERLYEAAGVKAISQRVTLARKALALLHPTHPAAVAPAPKAPTPSASLTKPKPIADKHAVAEKAPVKAAPKPVAKKPVPVRKRTKPVHHSTTHAKAKRH